ncbi:MAG: tetratricopeptide repeat protein [Candidatus Hydrogenedentota bacterium]
MARVDPAWGTEHLAAISRLEDTLGRPICGHFTQTGPCSTAPAAGGRCAAHSGLVPATMKRTSARRPGASSRTLLITVVGIAVALIVVGVASKMLHDPAEEIYRKAVALIAADRRAEAEPLLSLLMREHPDSPYAAKAKEIMTRSHPRSSEPAEQLYNEARNFYLSGRRQDYEEAARRYLAVVEKFPKDPLAREALYEAALCMDYLGHVTETVRLWRQFLREYGDDGRAPEALYALGFIHYTQLGKRDEGKAYLEELIAKYPDSSSADAARSTLGLPLDSDTSSLSAPAQPAAQSGPPSVLTTPGQL